MVEHEDIQMEQLAQRALTKFFFLAAGMSLLLFLPAGTVHFWQAWGFLCVFLGASFLLTVYLLMKNPELLKRRLRAGPTAEKEKTQKVIMSFAALGFVATMIVPAIDHRFLWSNVPPAVTIVSDALIALAFFLIFLVYRENSFGSATVQISEGQRVISTGPYALVRHPMYVGGLLLFLFMPLALGSYWGLLAFVAVFPAILLRLLHEEKFLARNLPGYSAYCAKVRWRLIPGVF